jgi:hypothetical protein
MKLPAKPTTASPDAADSELDPTERAFLSFLEADMAAHPERLAPVEAKWFARVKRLVKGVNP